MLEENTKLNDNELADTNEDNLEEMQISDNIIQSLIEQAKVEGIFIPDESMSNTNNHESMKSVYFNSNISHYFSHFC